jgi:SpoVK/Ycf46/Vps4 family AAA+-type ATPase
VKINDLVKATEGFTPGDIELASQRAASIAFDRARKGIEPSHITSYDFVQSISKTNASITSQIAKQFAEESKKFGRA